MRLDEQARQVLVDALIADGWVIDGDFVYAPRRTICFRCAAPWQGDLASMLERMQGRLERIRRNGPHSGYEAAFQDSIADTAGLLHALKRLVHTE